MPVYPMTPTVSILVPVYQSEKYIEQCLNSILRQTYRCLEVIIIDDATPDNSMDIINKLLHQPEAEGIAIQTIHHEKNLGIAATRNDLLDHATGDFILFVDSDDFIAEDAVQTLVCTATATGADLVRSDYYAYHNASASVVHIPSFTDKEQLLSQHIAAWGTIEALWQLLIRRSLIEQHHLRFAQDINASEDHLMMIKLYFYAHLIATGTKPVYYYRIDNEQSATHVNPKAFHLFMLKAMDHAIKFLKEKGVYNTYREAALTRTFLVKQTFLLNKESRNIDLYIDTYPECNTYYTKFNYSRSQVLLFKLAASGHRTLLKLLTQCSSASI